ncbi:B12-binding domain-containing radical SAM protein [Spirulina sp. 06S082]|uniref:B12-binding domain-containing radical SAM protein n=1 Tax=Spirulina sp. 06S082 TaxID=3110248 RepID=UPI002B2035E0|nr:radical SAM protein [Spirulina sp. 06S082]MEA5470149.1 radical SAM protein [Spirulina sp. 06S082]
MRVGILDIIVLPSTSLMDRVYHVMLSKQFASIVPQVISVWCRQLGHETFYATHYGAGDAFRLLPDDLDVVFFGCCSLASPLAYALAKFYRRAGTTTVIGGPHAEAFPVDCLRFFDLVIGDCDKSFIADIIDGKFERGQYISAAQPFEECPTVEERMPEIKAAAFFQKRWSILLTMVPMLTSRGCPYTCDFCRDWDNSYRLLSMERLAADIRYVSRFYPNLVLGFNDPNFGIQFERVFQVLESIPPESRVRYGMECSLSILNESRLKRLQDTKCILSIHGIESWQDYSTKAGVKNQSGIEKVDRVVEQLKQVSEYIPYIQVGLIFGLDSDRGDEPITLSKRFIEKTPFAWPVFNIPMPFGGTPMFDQYFENDRILKAMPLAFYSFPYLAFTLKNYDPITYFEKLIELSQCVSSPEMLKKRIQSTPNWRIKIFHWLRTQGEKAHEKKYHEILTQLKTDSNFLAFHEGKSETLPDFYRHQLKVMLGRYAELISPEELHPCLEQKAPRIVGSPVGVA